MTVEPRYPFVYIDVPEELSDDASALLFELGAEGVEERDASTLARGAHTAEGLVTLVGAFTTPEAAAEACTELDAAWSPRVEEVVGDAWRDAWKEHFHPFAITPRITVRPPWEAHAPTAEGEQVLELEPGRAFGTGLHATTSLVARALDAASAEIAGKTVLDVGTGSGILALAALLLGAARAVAIDNDPEAIEVTRENAGRNGLADRVDASVTPVEQLAAAFPVVLANIEARVLIPMAPALSARVAPGGLLVLSGILDGQESSVLQAYQACRPFADAGLAREGEWVSLSLRAPA
jgi:ribosomal protein L11 methyltransferase